MPYALIIVHAHIVHIILVLVFSCTIINGTGNDVIPPNTANNIMLNPVLVFLTKTFVDLIMFHVTQTTESITLYGQLYFKHSPEDGSVEIVCVHAMNGVQVVGSSQLGCELDPGHLQNLIGDVSLYDLDKMLHLMSVQLQLPELHRAACAFHQC